MKKLHQTNVVNNSRLIQRIPVERLALRKTLTCTFAVEFDFVIF